MRRRQFITFLGGAAASWPLVARAQPQASLPVVGLLEGADDPIPTTALRLGLSQSGFVEGKSVTFEYRHANGQYDRLPALAAELVRRQVAVIGTVTPVAAVAAKAATATIPIVFILGSDPVRDGVVASLNRPGGNVTGVTFFSNLLAARRLELLHETVPKASAIAILLNPNNSNAELELNETEKAARTLGCSSSWYARLMNAKSMRPSRRSFNSERRRCLSSAINTYIPAAVRSCCWRRAMRSPPRLAVEIQLPPARS
jgi:putative tryptophan/tyrosine transport system substrate-binding protein